MEKYTTSLHEFNISKDLVNPIFTLGFKDSTDKGFQFRTSNTEITFRFKKHDYYSLLDTLISEVIDEYIEEETSSPLLDDFQDYLRNKFIED